MVRIGAEWRRGKIVKVVRCTVPQVEFVPEDAEPAPLQHWPGPVERNEYQVKLGSESLPRPELFARGDLKRAPRNFIDRATVKQLPE
jgi:hypothetical protein